MIKNELADALTEQTELSKSQALHTVDELTGIIKRALAAGENVYLRGFGTFKLESRAARKGRNVRGNSVIDIPARRIVKFIPSIELKNSIKNEK